jgi:lipopolysaccharide/colanic/teichoic acid biosynthesis glycosyltransferase
MYKLLIKPFLDFNFSLFALIILSPFLLFLIIFLSIENKGNPFFCQIRPGKNGKIFKLVKFRTMVDKSDSEGILLPDNQRITRIGRLMRSASIDELPQLVNILSFKMSFIGPRPLLKEYLPLYNTQQARRQEVRPGITGWAQVNGRNAISWNERFKLDVWYIDNLTFLLDLKIFFKTIFKVINRQGINSSEQFTMKAFNGNN